MKSIIKRILVIAGNWIIALMLGLNLAQLYRTYLSAQAAQSEQLLSNNPDQLLSNIQNTSPSIWLWLASGISLIISLFILVGWFIPKFRRQLWFWRLSYIWLWFWIIYLIAAVILLIVLVNSLF